MPTTSLSILQSIPTRRKGVDDTVQIGTEHLSHAPGPAACMRVGPVVESIGNVGSLSSQGGGSNRVAGHRGEIGLPAQNLTKPPVIPRHPGQTDSIGEIACSQVEVESGNAADRRQGSGQQCWVAEFTRGGMAPSTRPPRSMAAVNESSTALSATARAYSAGSVSPALKPRSRRTEPNQVKPYRSRPRPCQTGSSDEASVRAAA